MDIVNSLSIFWINRNQYNLYWHVQPLPVDCTNGATAFLKIIRSTRNSEKPYRHVQHFSVNYVMELQPFSKYKRRFTLYGIEFFFFYPDAFTRVEVLVDQKILSEKLKHSEC